MGLHGRGELRDWCRWLRVQIWKEMWHTASSIEKPVAGLDGIIDNVGAALVGNLPQAESDLGHLVAIIELEKRAETHGC
jgi:hypothetical protein